MKYEPTSYVFARKELTRIFEEAWILLSIKSKGQPVSWKDFEDCLAHARKNTKPPIIHETRGREYFDALKKDAGENWMTYGKLGVDRAKRLGYTFSIK
jgi:hypothetical protein